MTEISEVAERVAARRAELDEEEMVLVEWLEKVRAEREELAAAKRVWERMHPQLESEKSATRAVPAQVGGRGVLLVSHRGPGHGGGGPPARLPADHEVRAGGGRRVAPCGSRTSVSSWACPSMTAPTPELQP
ncbi:hypothetical protein GCM10010377_73060 [Streptomyces viridiviolaceus]|nr:hypothetical protein GCM10010377_73060 [Streptomyces viridiviolaceus]